jgi:hypothetical protein
MSRQGEQEKKIIEKINDEGSEPLMTKIVITLEVHAQLRGLIRQQKAWSKLYKSMPVTAYSYL